jgi:CubicO group peptidase (beta-lactamase class C family)
MTKPVCTVAALILVERGELSLDDPVAKWIPAFANGQVFVSGCEIKPVAEPVTRDVTIRDLMMHTSGLSYGIFGSTPVEKILQEHVGKDWVNFYRNTTLEDLSNAAGKTPLSFQPGTKWQYGLSIEVLGRVIEVVSGSRLDQFFYTEIFEPLGMKDTGFYVKAKDISRLADCYDFKATSGFEISHVPERDRSEMPVLLSGGGGLVSSIMDYSLFVKSFFSESKTRLLRPETIKLMHTNLLPGGKTLQEVGVDGFSEVSGAGMGFGLGVSVVTDPTVAPGCELSNVGEFGWGGLASTTFFIDPVKNLSCIFFSQVIPSTSLNVRSQLRWLAHRLSDELSS